MDFYFITFRRINVITYIRDGGYNFHVEFPVQTLLYNFHVQHPQKSTTETKTKSQRGLWSISKRRIIELKFLKGSPQIFKILSNNWINTSKHHGFHFLKSLDGCRTRILNMRYCISNLYLCSCFNTRNDITNITGGTRLSRLHMKTQNSDFVRIIFFSRCYKFHKIIGAQGSIYDFKISNNATKRIKYRIKNQTLQRSVRISDRRCNTFNNSIQHCRHTLSCFSTGTKHITMFTAQQFHNLVFHLIWHSSWQINLI